MSGRATEPKPRKCGAYTRRRGYEFEREFVNFMLEYGIPCRRHFMSGMFEKGDGTLEPPCLPGTKLKWQAKRKKEIPAWLELDEHDLTVVRGDRGEMVVVMRASLARDLFQ